MPKGCGQPVCSCIARIYLPFVHAIHVNLSLSLAKKCPPPFLRSVSSRQSPVSTSAVCRVPLPARPSASQPRLCFHKHVNFRKQSHPITLCDPTTICERRAIARLVLLSKKFESFKLFPFSFVAPRSVASLLLYVPLPPPTVSKPFTHVFTVRLVDKR